jgi:thiol-disulfide isomerase/thioredoxin
MSVSQRVLQGSCGVLAVLAMVAPSLSPWQQPAQAQSTTFVMLTASWCAPCRPVLQAVQAVAKNQGAAVVQVDVDSPSAPDVAKKYGVSILRGHNVPLVYRVRSGDIDLVVDGAADAYGDSDTLQAQLLAP